MTDREKKLPAPLFVFSEMAVGGVPWIVSDCCFQEPGAGKSDLPPELRAPERMGNFDPDEFREPITREYDGSEFEEAS